MKRKSLLLILTVCLCASLFCFACGKKNEPHKHNFDGIVVTTNPVKTEYNAFEQFDMTGIEVSKHCTGQNCKGEVVAAEEVTFEYEKDGADKLTADMTKVVIKVGDYTTDLAITVNKLTVNLPTIASKEYNGEAQVADVAASDLYTVTENNGGTAVGEYDVKLTLKDAVNYAFENTEGATVTLKFAIIKISNTITIGEIAAISCKQTPTITATANENATISYVYSATEDGEYTESIEGGFVAGTYYVKAIAAETADYAETTSAAKSFTVNHAFHEWNTEDDEQDVGVCACGEELTDMVFNKVVTDARQDIILTDAAHSLTLGGISAYASVKSIKYGELSFGNDISALNLPADINDAVHGEQNLTVIVTDDYGLDHTVTVPVTIVTESISTLARLKEIISVNARDLGKRCEGKYYILANDVTVDSYFFNKMANGDALTWDNAGNGFAGTLDGRNNKLIGGNMYGGGMFGSIESGTVKNIVFDKVNVVGTNRTLVAGTLFNATLENITINIVDKKTVSGGSYFGILATHPVKNLTLKNVTINAEGSSFPWIIGHHSTNNDPKNYHFENVKIIADFIGCFASGNSGKLYLDEISGVSYKLKGSATAEETIDPKNFGDGFVYTLTSPWNRYSAVKSVKLGDTDITESVMIIGDDEKDLVFDNLADYITADMYNKTVMFTVELDASENNTVVIALSVGVLDINEAVELTTRQDVVLKDAAGDKTTFTLNLGDYSGYTVTKVEYGGAELNLTGNTITISDAMKNGAHGEQTIYVTAAGDKVNYRIAVPVTIVTENVSTFDELVNCVTYKSGYAVEYQKGKYFTLANDINVSSYNTGSAQTWESGFAGTLDGRGKSLVGGGMYGGGLFGVLNGATIKNIEFKDVQAGGAGGNRVLFAQHIKSATILNVKIYITSKTDMLNQQYLNSVIACGHVANLTMTDVLIDATGSKLPFILGQGSVNSNIKAQNVVVKADVLECILKDASGTRTSVEGITFESTATTAA